MTYRSISEAKHVLANMVGLSDQQKFDYQRAIDRAEADALSRGTRMLEGRGQRMSAEVDELTEEASAVANKLDAIATQAERPDSDARQLAKLYEDLSREALVIKERSRQVEERAAKHNEDIGDPIAFHEDFTERWAGMSVQGRESWLHLMPFGTAPGASFPRGLPRGHTRRSPGVTTAGKCWTTTAISSAE